MKILSLTCRFCIPLLAFFPVLSFSQITISSDTTWASNQVLNQSVVVNPNVKLRIGGGVQVEINFVDVNSDSAGDIKFEILGELVLNGQPCNPVAFKPTGGTPISGTRHWKGIHLNSPASMDSLSFFFIQNADSGMWTHSNASISEGDFFQCGLGLAAFPGTKLSLNDSRLYSSRGTGLQIYSSDITVVNCLIHSNGRFGIASHSGMLNLADSDISNNSWGGVFIGSGNFFASNCNLSLNAGAGVEISEWSFDTDFDINGLKSANPNLTVNFCNIEGNSPVGVSIPDSIAGKIISWVAPWTGCTGGSTGLGLNQCSSSVAFEVPFGSIDTASPDVSHVWKHSLGTHYPMVYTLQNAYDLSGIDTFPTTASGTDCSIGSTQNDVLEAGEFVVPVHTDRYLWKTCGLTNDTVQRPTLQDGWISMKTGDFQVNSTVGGPVPMNFAFNYWGVQIGAITQYNEVDTANIDTLLPTNGQFSPCGYLPKNYYPAGNLGGDTSVCPGTILVLGNKSIGTDYLWSTGDTTKTINVILPDTYSVAVSSICGSSTDQIVVSHFTKPNVTLAGDTLLCQGESVTLIASGANSYIWSSGTSTNPAAKFYPTDTTVYSVIGTDAKGCRDTAMITIYLQQVDTSFSISGDSLIANVPDTLQWLDCQNGMAAIQGETKQQFLPLANGSFALAVTQGPCTDTSNCHTVTITGSRKSIPGSGIRFFPNPVTDKICLRSNGVINNTWIEIRDLTARLLLTVQVKPNENSCLDLPGFSAGTYFLIIQNEKGRFFAKFVRM